MENEEEKAGGPQESKADRFKRLAEPRVSNAIRRIELIGNLSGSSYEFTVEQVEKILASLRAAVDEVEKKFQKGLNKKGYNDHGRFRL